MKRKAHLFGIRHHGPGSAALLRSALDRLDPECVLIEGHPEGNDLIPHAALPGMKPPLAMMFYSVDAAKNAVFAPFAEFSPEWVAMRWALERNRTVRFIDWPAAVSLAVRTAAVSEPVVAEEADDGGETASVDPLDRLAVLGGYSDGETFWNALIEQGYGGSDPVEVFHAIEAAMTEARREHDAERILGAGRAQRDEWREAFMRLNIRDALRQHEGAVAAVVGAWHLGGLRVETSATEDKALIRDLPKIKVAATWSPWTDSRLTFASGYGAGVTSPGWYAHLWKLYEHGSGGGIDRFTALWQAKTASLLRDEGFEASTASAIEASRLAVGLASLRGLPLPGMAEMRDASLSVLCNGDEDLFELVQRKLYVGSGIGEIDPAVPQMPLADDMAKTARKLRLVQSEDVIELKLDLRTENGLARSVFLHRLDILGISWGKLVDAGSGRGTFREIWQLGWSPEMSIRLAEALVWGLTVEQASAAFLEDKASRSSDVRALAEAVNQALLADLPDTAERAIAMLQKAAVNISDVSDLMQAVVPLARIARYGTARRLPEQELRNLVYALSVEINNSVRIASHSLEAEAADARVSAMREYDNVLHPFGDQALVEDWQRELSLMVDDAQVHPAVAGLSLRLLHDQKAWNIDDVSAAFSRHLSGRPPMVGGQFLETFVRGSSEIFIQDGGLLNVVDAWVTGLGEEDFIESLPLLRRAFSEFEPAGRKRIFERLASGRRENVGAGARPATSSPAFEGALPLLRTILGLAA